MSVMIIIIINAFVAVVVVLVLILLPQSLKLITPPEMRSYGRKLGRSPLS